MPVKDLQAIREHGFTILKGVVDLEHIQVLKEKMLEDLAKITARKDKPYNWNAGNVQQEPPPMHPYLFKDVLLNEEVIKVSSALLGPGVKNAYYQGNTAMPRSTERQPVHCDVGQLWRPPDPPGPVFGLVVNVPVVDVSPENGGTEIWPGSHQNQAVIHNSGDIKVPLKALEAQRLEKPPFQLSMRAGDVLIRDIRLWHAGMPNWTGEPRPMIAMIHWISWWNTETVDFPKGTEDFFKHPVLATQVRFVDGPVDYIGNSQGYEFSG